MHNASRLTIAYLLSAGVLLGGAIEATAQSREVMIGEYPAHTVGSDTASVTVTEFASLTCSHCASFHESIYPDLKKHYIDTGKIRFEIVEVYFDQYGLIAAVVARCGGPEKYFDLVELILAKQTEWSHQPTGRELVERLASIARSLGMSNTQLNQCLRDEEKVSVLTRESDRLVSKHNIRGTPSFVIEGKTYTNMGYDEFASILDKALN